MALVESMDLDLIVIWITNKILCNWKLLTISNLEIGVLLDYELSFFISVEWIH